MSPRRWVPLARFFSSPPNSCKGSKEAAREGGTAHGSQDSEGALVSETKQPNSAYSPSHSQAAPAFSSGTAVDCIDHKPPCPTLLLHRPGIAAVALRPLTHSLPPSLPYLEDQA
jgi:hypothetical protein